MLTLLGVEGVSSLLSGGFSSVELSRSPFGICGGMPLAITSGVPSNTMKTVLWSEHIPLGCHVVLWQCLATYTTTMSVQQYALIQHQQHSFEKKTI